MKLILSSLLLSTSIAIVCAAPGAMISSSAFEEVASSSIVAALSEEAVPTVDAREAAWARMKVALPDGVFPEDRMTSERLQHTSDEKVVPMIVMSKNDFPPSYLLKKPLYKHQRVPLSEEGPAYKHLGAAATKESFDPVLVAPLLPEAQEELNMEHQLEQGKIDLISNLTIH